MELTIKVLQNDIVSGNTLKIIIEPSSTVIELKNAISSTTHCEISCMRILMLKDFNEILLTDENFLQSYDISPNSKLMLDIFSIVSLQELEVRERMSLKKESSEQQQPLPHKDWLGLIVEKIKIGSLTGMLQIIGEYEREKAGSLIEDDEDLLSTCTSDGSTPLHYACVLGHSNIVQLLVARQVNPNRENLNHYTPLMLACKEKHIECVRSLLKHPRIQVNKMTEEQNSALHKACKSGIAIIVQMLIEHRASMVLEDQNMMIPLQYATSNEIFDLIPRYMGEIELQKARGEYRKVVAESMEGDLYLTGDLMIHDKLLYVALDTEIGNFMCFNDKNDWEKGGRPLVHLKIATIWDVKYSVGLPFGNKDAECFTLKTREGNFKFYSNDKDSIEEWIDAITKGIEYCQVNKIGLSHSVSVIGFNNEINEDVLMKNHLDQDRLINFKCFTVLEEIGSGSFGKVYKVIKNDTKQVFALKQLNKEFLIKQKQLKYAIGECKILAYLNHPFIIKLNYAFQTPKNLYMVLDYCPNGDLMTHLGEKSRFPESVAKFYIAEIILAIEYLHTLDIVYRDLKPENILLDRAGHIRLADFGLAKENVNPLNPAMSFCGSPAYLAPELLSKTGSEKSADVYGIGAILFELLCGMPPFYSDNIKELFRNIKRGMLQFPKIVKNDSQDIMRQLMNKDPNKRPKLSQVKSHVFFKDINWEELEMKITKPPRLGSKWVQMDDYSEKVANPMANQFIEDEDYLEGSLDQVADFNFSRSSASYLG